MAERRASARQRSLLRGSIYFNNRCSAVDCLVRDLSTRGARLVLSEHVSIPDNIELYIAQKRQTLRAHVQWHQGDEAGVTFAQAGQAPSTRGTDQSAGVRNNSRQLASSPRWMSSGRRGQQLPPPRPPGHSSPRDSAAMEDACQLSPAADMPLR